MIAISDNDTVKFKEYAPFRLLCKRNRRKGEEMKNSDLQKEDVRKQYKPQKSKPLRFNTRVLYAGRLQRVSSGAAITTFTIFWKSFWCCRAAAKL